METKHCARCATTKPVTEFFSNRARHDGLSGYCRPCQTSANNGRQATQRVKVLDALGGPVCKRCGFSDTRALVIDHIDGGGNQHRKDSVSSWVMNKYALEHLSEFQVLCCNCNQIKRHENDEWGGKAYVAKVQATRREVAPRVGRWARDFDACIECGQATAKHKARGVCLNCYMRALRPKMSAEDRLAIKQASAAAARERREITGRRMVAGPDGKRHWSRPGDQDYPG